MELEKEVKTLKKTNQELSLKTHNYNSHNTNNSSSLNQIISGLNVTSPLNLDRK